MSRTRSETVKVGVQANKDMNMIRHAVDRYELMPAVGVLDNAGDVFVEFIPETWLDQTLPPLHSEHKMNIELGKGVGHCRSWIAIVENKQAAPTAL
jgi:hypothetical protein